MTHTHTQFQFALLSVHRFPLPPISRVENTCALRFRGCREVMADFRPQLVAEAAPVFVRALLRGRSTPHAMATPIRESDWRAGSSYRRYSASGSLGIHDTPEKAPLRLLQRQHPAKKAIWFDHRTPVARSGLRGCTRGLLMSCPGPCDTHTHTHNSNSLY